MAYAKPNSTYLCIGNLFLDFTVGENYKTDINGVLIDEDGDAREVASEQDYIFDENFKFVDE